ncbi:ATP-binding protein [Fannyhessea vaginae]|uniref:ATP-binding protein n=1 Tax=Fannyhessea vaginae TaxID=82135 RepID=UPI00336A7AC2
MSMNNSPSTTNPSTCKYCGKKLVKRTATLLGKCVFAGYEPCECDQALRACAAQAVASRQARMQDAEADLCRRLERAGVGVRFQAATHPQATELAQALKQGKNVFISGAVGSGKTHLACAVARTLLADNLVRSVQFARCVSLFDEIKRSFNAGTDALAPYRTCGVLVLDDLGKQASTPWSLERLFDLVDDRYARCLPTITTSNYNPRDLIVHLACSRDMTVSQAIVSRLLNDCVHITTKHEDNRIKAA